MVRRYSKLEVDFKVVHIKQQVISKTFITHEYRGTC